MKIWLEVYLPFRGTRPWRGWEEIAAGTTPAMLLADLGLGGHGDVTVIVDGRWARPDQPIAGEDVAVLRQAEGG